MEKISKPNFDGLSMAERYNVSYQFLFELSSEELKNKLKNPNFNDKETNMFVRAVIELAESEDETPSQNPPQNSLQNAS